MPGETSCLMGGVSHAILLYITELINKISKRLQNGNRNTGNDQAFLEERA
jgi:hypothetical protein